MSKITLCMLTYNHEDLRISLPQVLRLFKLNLISQFYLLNDKPESDLEVSELMDDIIYKDHLDLKEKILIINHSFNKGMLSSRLELIHKVTTDYMVFCDSDDLQTIEGMMYFNKVTKVEFKVGLVGGVVVKLSEETTTKKIMDFVNNPNLYKKLNLPKWRDEFYVNSLLNTKALLNTINEFESEISELLSLNNNKINYCEDVVVTRFFKAYLYNNDYQVITGPTPIVLGNYYISRKDYYSAEYITKSERLDYINKIEEFCKSKIKLKYGY